MIRIIRDSALHEAVLKETTIEAFYKVENYFEKKGIEIVKVEPYIGLDNKKYGDFLFVLKKGNRVFRVNIDFKRQDRDRPFIPIELVQISKTYGMDSWLYNSDIHICVYSFRNGDVYLFKHPDLLSIAAYYNTDKMWNRCIVYNRESEKYKEEREWINEQLKPFEKKQLTNEDEKMHINGAFNYGWNGEKRHSGFCLNLTFESAESFKI